jgi:5'-nucleotidase/UDP-sugar diphosphatase
MLYKTWRIIALLTLSYFGIAPLGLAGDGELILLHTNDIHGAFLPQTANWIENRPMIGGFAALSGVLDSRPSEGKPFLLLDAGDFMTGNPITDLKVGGAIGGAMLEFFQLLGYHAVTLGNHEFDISSTNARKLVEASRVPIISANVWLDTDDQDEGPSRKLLTGDGWEIFTIGGIRVGVIGLILKDLAGSVSIASMENIQVSPPLEEVQNAVEEIDDDTDLIVLLTHQGLHRDIELAEEIGSMGPASSAGRQAKVDVIIGGHSHTRMTQPDLVNGVIIFQADAYCRFLGKLWLRVENDRVTDYQGELIPLWADSLQPNQEVVHLIDTYQKMLDRKFNKVIANLDEDWVRSGIKECALGDWLADRLREYGQADFAVINSGGVRKDLLAGPVRIMDIKEMLPFANRVVEFQCSGHQIQTMLNINAYAGATQTREILQISGLRYKIAKSADGEYIAAEIIVADRPLQPDKIYRGVTVDYVAMSQPERYFGFVPETPADLGILFTELIIREITKRGNLVAPPGGRIVSLVSGTGEKATKGY